MRSERRAILALVAAGRISAAEAERLLRAWNEPAQWFLAALVGLALVLTQPGLHAPAAGALWFHQVVQSLIEAVHSAAAMLLKAKEGSV